MNSRPGNPVYNPPDALSLLARAQWDGSLDTIADLAGIKTLRLNPKAIRGWIQASDGTLQVWYLLTSTAATVADVSQRPYDYDPSNPKVWFKAPVGSGGSVSFPLTGNVGIPPNTIESGLILANSNDATSGNESLSPAFELQGSGFDDAVPGSYSVKWRFYVRPVETLGNPNGSLIFQSSVNGGAWNNMFSIASDGSANFTFVGTAGVEGGYVISDTYIRTLGNSLLFNVGAGLFELKALATGSGTKTLYMGSGTGSPEGVIVATVGAIYTRTDGGAGTTLYVKESGTGNTGWAAK